MVFASKQLTLRWSGRASRAVEGSVKHPGKLRPGFAHTF